MCIARPITLCLLSGLALLLSISGSRAAEVSIPETPAGAALTSWLEVVRSGDKERLESHYETGFEEDFRADVPAPQYLALSIQIGPLLSSATLARIDAPAPHRLTAWYQAGAAWLEIRLEVQRRSPHLISGLLIQPTPPPDDEKEEQDAEWSNLRELLEIVRKDASLPALAAAHVKDGKIVDRAVVGVRTQGEEEAAEISDLWHIGSITKSMTAVLVARLVEQKKLRWDLTVAEVLPDVEMLPVYRKVTLEQLLRHRGGIPAETNFDEATGERLASLPGTPVEQRATYLAEILKKEPAAPPGTATVYSNAGYALAGHMAERVAGKSWNELLQTEVFTPLGLTSAGLGWPFSDDRPHQPRGHFPDGSGLRPQITDEYRLGEFLAPAGDVHCSIKDLARYASFHLRGLAGEDGALKAETVALLHTPPPGAEYACGWVITWKSRRPVHWHNGSAGTFYAHVFLHPDRNEAIVMATNAAPGGDRAAERIARELDRRRRDR